MSTREAITIGVDKQILWIGGDSYPQHNIARARTATLVPRRGKAVLLWGVLAAGGASGNERDVACPLWHQRDVASLRPNRDAMPRNVYSKWRGAHWVQVTL